jgi:hypothetical protein
MISFRVSEDEYVGLKNLCVNEGARSVSDMARDAVQRMITGHSWPNNQLATVVLILQNKVEALNLEVQRLDRAINGQVSAPGVAVRNGNGNGDH